jgi:GTP-binding protein Era
MTSPGEERITRSGAVALIGRSNVGKSTLMNAALALPLAIVSDKPQTTRARLLGIVRHAGAEIGLIDTPGLHHPRTQLGKEMNRAARLAAKEADVVIFVVQVPARPGSPDAMRPHSEDRKLAAELPEETPVVLVINKIDRLGDKRMLLPFIAAYAELRAWAAVVPISALREDGIARVLDEIAPLLPEGPPSFAPEAFTDRPVRWLAAEYLREPILEATSEEVPHAVAVTIDRFIEPAGGGAVHIDATIHVERSGQKAILIGNAGRTLKIIGTSARKRIESLLDRQVHLEIWVRVTKNWRERRELIHELGVTDPGSGEP